MFEKPYSKEECEEIVSEAKHHKSERDSLRNQLASIGFIGGMLDIGTGQSARIQDKVYHELLEKLDRLKNTAHGEALKLNREYDKLLRVAKKANDDLRNFEEQYLGKPQETSTENDSQKIIN